MPAISQTADAPSLEDWAHTALAPLGHQPAAHHKLLLGRLQAVADGEIDRLLVLMPPGSAKSTYASIIFPAWWLRRFPHSSILAASHTASLSGHFGRQLRNMIAEADPTVLARDSRAAHAFATTAGGGYFSSGVRGPLIGRRADLALIDDPIKSHEVADSAASRQAIWDWYRSELMTRLKPKARIVVAMTRWHEDDLAGRLLASQDSWQTLRLPAFAEAGDPLGRLPGAPLWPEWEDAAELARKRSNVGPRVWQSQYQQDPAPAEGALFHPERIAIADAAPAGLTCARGWDLAATAATGGRDPDWTAGVKLGRSTDGRTYVLDVVRLRGGPHEVAQAITATASRDGRSVPIGLPQDPGQAGKQQVAWLAGQLAGWNVKASPETGSKIIRASPLAAQMDAGNLVLLRGAWNSDFIDEISMFPNGRKDDQVDAASRAFSLLTEPTTPTRRMNMSFLSR
jgi:predicted phage terminase large subunit-like protein